MSELDKYHWSGHGVLVGKINHEWQDRDYVLSLFGEKGGEARRASRKHVQEGIDEGRHPELVGGGLVRSVGGWSQVLSLRRENERVLADERILGPGDFVRRVVREADERIKYQVGDNEQREKARELIEQTCKDENVNPNELRMGSRRGRIAQVRSEIAYQLVEKYGFPLAEVACQLGVTTSAISKAICRL